MTDILFFRFRARGGLLAEVDEADKFILDGRYYEEFPAHILGTVVPNEPGKRGWHTSAEGYTVVGDFTALPPPHRSRPLRMPPCEATSRRSQHGLMAGTASALKGRR